MKGGISVMEVTLRDDPRFSSTRQHPHYQQQLNSSGDENQNYLIQQHRSKELPCGNADGYRDPISPFEYVLRIDPGAVYGNNDSNDHDDNIDGNTEIKIRDDFDGGDDLIGLTHLHEPAILHALRTRYDKDIIYTNTGPILIAINPFKKMDTLYGPNVMDEYRRGGEMGSFGSSDVKAITSPRTAAAAAAAAAAATEEGGGEEDEDFIGNLSMVDDDESNDDDVDSSFTSKKEKTTNSTTTMGAVGVSRLPPHVYRTADDAYRAMMRGIEMNTSLDSRAVVKQQSKGNKKQDDGSTPTNQSILVSGESGAGKTVTTKIVLNYLAMLSKRVAEVEESTFMTIAMATSTKPDESIVRIERQERQVLNSNSILEAFGNARTIRNDNSSRFGKYIDVRFSHSGKLMGATIDTYLLEKVRLIRQTAGERNFHIFYQFLESKLSKDERLKYHLGEHMGLDDFALVNKSGTYDRRDMVSDIDMHTEMLHAMKVMGFNNETVQDILRLIVAILHAGNMTFDDMNHGETCALVKDSASLAVASLLGVSYENLAASLTSRVLFIKEGNITKELNSKQGYKAAEGLIKSMYGANFDYIVEAINRSIQNIEHLHDRSTTMKDSKRQKDTCAYIGVLDIFGFETFESNSFEQLCINYTNETLQQHFNQHVFKLEQQEYEREGILWKFISFPDNQDVLDLINMKNVGIFAILDEQCIVEWGSDDKFVQQLYTRCESHYRFEVTAAQKPYHKFSVDHYAGLVEYSTDEWIEKNKDQLPIASVELLTSSTFGYIGKLQVCLYIFEQSLVPSNYFICLMISILCVSELCEGRRCWRTRFLCHQVCGCQVR